MIVGKNFFIFVTEEICRNKSYIYIYGFAVLVKLY